VHFQAKAGVLGVKELFGQGQQGNVPMPRKQKNQPHPDKQGYKAGDKSGW
jgi:hypothetical protein